MIYMTKEDAVNNGFNLDGVGSISVTGSVIGMRNKYGWEKGGQVRVSGFIYNIGKNEVERARSLGILRGT